MTTHSLDDLGRRARRAARELAQAAPALKASALTAMAQAARGAAGEILAENEADMEQARSEGIGAALLDRLRLDPARVEGFAAGLDKVAGLPDPVGVLTGGWTLPNGIRLERRRVPLGVVAVIYEARPNVTADAGGLCLKAGNAALLRGSSYALRSNRAITAALQAGLAESGLPADAVQLIEDTTRAGARALMTATEWVDLLVPRGGPGLIAAIEAEARVPVVIDGAGNCHVYVDAAADLAKPHAIVVNAKCQRPGVCNATETLLMHQAVAAELLPGLIADLQSQGVEVRGDEETAGFGAGVVAATEADWETEFHALILAIRVVPGIDEALEHIREYGTGHTEAIVSEDYGAVARFVAGVDAAATMVNASTRFTDGEEFGFGAEIGISTQKLHARGPMGPEVLTSERYVLYGDGHVR